MVRKSVLVVLTALLLLGTGSYAFAASQSSFSISPPPVPYPIFDAKETNIKVGLSYLSMKSTDPSMNFELSGGGVNFFGRTSFGTVVALDYGIGVMYMDGDINIPGIGKTDIAGANIPISVNLEVQPFKNDVFNVILFAGPAFNITAMEVDTSYTIMSTTYNDTMYIDTFLYGPQGGVQLGIGMGDFNLDLFAMATNLRGTQDTTSTYGTDTSTDIEAYTTTSYGADLMYMPWGLALSSILQEAKQDENNGFKTKLYTISWSYKF